MESFNNYLKSFPHYTPAVFEKVRPFLSIKYLEPHDYFLEDGKVCKKIGYIEEGLLRLYYLKDGKEVTNCFCKENTITCSYQSLISQEVSDLAIQAIEPCKLIVLSNDALQRLYGEDLFWQQVGRIASENEYMITTCHHRFLNDLTATERYLEILNTDAELFQRVPLNYLASYLQIAPETLSRIRKKISRT